MNVMPERRLFSRKLDLKNGTIDLMHGAGGKASAQLVEEFFLPAFWNPELAKGDDGGAFAGQGRMVVATDSHVVSPIFFPGGNIGHLAVHGTLNDVAMGGAKPLHLTVGFILEEGFPLCDLKVIVETMGYAAREAGVTIIAGDTKVVERGKGDGVFINTTGIGMIPDHIANPPAASRMKAGDKIILSGPIGSHGVSILAARNDLPLQSGIESDTAAVHEMVTNLQSVVADIHALRDPTRGGLATAINELCRSSCVGAVLFEDAIPIDAPVAAAAEILGVDPLYLANEGLMIAVVDGADADKALEVIKAHPKGAKAAIVGTVTDDPGCFVQMETAMGGRRMVDWLTGDPLPRIC